MNAIKKFPLSHIYVLYLFLEASRTHASRIQNMHKHTDIILHGWWMRLETANMILPTNNNIIICVSYGENVDL